MTNHVPQLTTCQKLKEAGFPQNTYFYWGKSNSDSEHDLVPGGFEGSYLGEWDNVGAAPILTEILEQLPKKYRGPALQAHPVLLGWEIGFPRAKVWQHHDNPAEAAALLWLELNKE